MKTRQFWIGLSACLLGCTATDYEQTQIEAAAIGCGVGAAFGNLIGKDTKSTVTGCVAAGAAGLAYGTHVADQKQQYVSQEEHFRAVIESAQMHRAEVAAYNRQLNIQIAEVRRETEQLKVSSDNTYKNNQDLTRKKEETARLIKQAEDKIARLQWEIDKQKSFLASNEQEASVKLVNASQQEISQLESEHRTLQIALAELRSIDNRRAH